MWNTAELPTSYGQNSRLRNRKAESTPRMRMCVERERQSGSRQDRNKLLSNPHRQAHSPFSPRLVLSISPSSPRSRKGAAPRPWPHSQVLPLSGRAFPRLIRAAPRPNPVAYQTPPLLRVPASMGGDEASGRTENEKRIPARGPTPSSRSAASASASASTSTPAFASAFSFSIRPWSVVTQEISEHRVSHRPILDGSLDGSA
mmetsp:Transcript_7730/g.22716  ORF Transcript_7730/g.22716 Transcript_7730/m.22716 type:complete len:202 (+) Transcript_7730:323-928(+)